MADVGACSTGKVLVTSDGDALISLDRDGKLVLPHEAKPLSEADFARKRQIPTTAMQAASKRAWKDILDLER